MTSRLKAKAIAIAGRLKPTSFDLGEGDLVAVIGPNGGGKTSLLRGLAAIERTSGEVTIDGEEVAAFSASRLPYLITYLPASRDLTWPISARDVIALGLPRADPARVEELIHLLELEGLADRRVDRLSTGERARILFARALAPNPLVLLLDEPLSNLDPYWVLRLIEILRDVARSGSLVLTALHDIERLTAFDRAILMADGELQANCPAREMLESQALEDAFRLRRGRSGWKIKQREDRQSSP